jgi:DNA replication protein DnaC
LSTLTCPGGKLTLAVAVALGLKACEQGRRVLFLTAMGLLASLGKALTENRLEERLKLLTQPHLLIFDEIGSAGRKAGRKGVGSQEEEKGSGVISNAA